MNILDIIIICILLYAIYSGVKDGVVLQVCSLLGIALGIYLGGTYSNTVASMLGITGKYSTVWGYAIIIILSIIIVSVVAHLLRKVLHIAGLGIFDIVLGALLSVCKCLLILSILFSVFRAANNSYNIVATEDLAQSKLFNPIADLTNWVTPAWGWTQNQIEKI